MDRLTTYKKGIDRQEVTHFGDEVERCWSEVPAVNV